MGRFRFWRRIVGKNLMPALLGIVSPLVGIAWLFSRGI